MVILNNNNKILKLAILIVFVLVLYQINKRLSTPSLPAINYAQHDVNTHSKNSTNNDGAKVTNVAIADTNKISTAAAPSPNRVSTENELKDEPSNHHIEWQQWRDSLLTPDNLFNSDYSYYDTETLSTLADDNDIIAMQVLALKLISNDGSPKTQAQSRELLKKATVLGARNIPFIESIQHSMFDLHQVNNIPSDNASPTQEKILTNIATDIALAERRGNPEIGFNTRRQLKERYNININENIIQQADELANNIYQELENERMAMGLAPFDNSAPASVKKMYQ